MPQESIYIPVILAITELVKRMGVPSKLAPIVAIILGIASAFLGANSYSIELALQGMALGLGASGLWSGSRAIIGK